MEKLTEKEYKELKDICDKIKVLKERRMEKFGKDWGTSLRRSGPYERRRSAELSGMCQIYIRKLDERLAIRGYTKGRLLGKLGLSRSAYFDLSNGYCSKRTSDILNDINWDDL